MIFSKNFYIKFEQTRLHDKNNFRSNKNLKKLKFSFISNIFNSTYSYYNMSKNSLTLTNAIAVIL